MVHHHKIFRIFESQIVGGRNGRPLILQRIRAAFRAFGAGIPPSQNEVRAKDFFGDDLFRKKMVYLYNHARTYFQENS